MVCYHIKNYNAQQKKIENQKNYKKKIAGTITFITFCALSEAKGIDINMKQEEQLSINKKKRSEILDIAKGLGIFFVVWSHAKGPFTQYMYQFHMPLFFLISGYLFNEKNRPAEFIIKKIKSLYIPFVFWNIFFVFLEAVFHLKEFTKIEFGKKIILILLTLEKDGMFMGATWFLGALFAVSVGYKIIDYYLGQVKNKSLFFAVLFGSVALTGFSITFPYLLSRTMILSFFYAMGRLVRECKKSISCYDTEITFLFSVAMFGLIGHYNRIDMMRNQYKYPMLFLIGAFLASYVVIFVSRTLERRTVYLKKFFIFMGENSLSIVIWQFVVFRIITVLQLLVQRVPLNTILDYYPPYKTEGVWWIVYIIIGIIGSVIIEKFISLIVNVITSKE